MSTELQRILSQEKKNNKETKCKLMANTEEISIVDGA